MEKRTAIDIANAKELRGNIIETLYTIYPNEISIGTLKGYLRYKGVNSEDDIKKAIYYLSGKKYIKVELTSDYWDNLILLTPLGINLAEHDFEDIGVIING